MFPKADFFMQLSSITMNILFAFIFGPSCCWKRGPLAACSGAFRSFCMNLNSFCPPHISCLQRFQCQKLNVQNYKSKNKPPDLSQPCPVHLLSWELKCCSRAGGSGPWSNYPADSSVPHSDGIICLQLTMLQQHNRTEKRDATTEWEEEGVISW